MRQTTVRIAALFGLVVLGCNKAEPTPPPLSQPQPQPQPTTEQPEASTPNVFLPKPLESMKAMTQGHGDTLKLDAELSTFLRGKYSIASATYYRTPADIPWVAITKTVQNQMIERSIQRESFAWFEPGIDLVEVYPQGDGAFAVAMPKGTKTSDAKVVGFFVLKRSER